MTHESKSLFTYRCTLCRCNNQQWITGVYEALNLCVALKSTAPI